MVLRRSLAVAAALGVALSVTGASAFACTNLATLNLSAASGKPGDTITVTGSSFRMPANVETGVLLRWNALDGPVLAEARPDRVGNISATITIPEAPPDNYVILAVLRDARGNDTSGTPARAAFSVVGGAGRPLMGPAGAPVATAPVSEGGASVPLALLVVLGVTGLGLFGAGFTAVARQTRRGEAPQPAPVRRG